MKENECNCVRCGYCCTEMEIPILHLAHPDIFLDEQGMEFFKAHGLYDALKTGEKIRVLHRCQHLTDKNLCGVEQEKPAYCAEWKCRRGLRDAQWFLDRRGEFAVATIEAIQNVFGKYGHGNHPDATHEIVLALRSYALQVQELEGGAINARP